MDEDIYNQAILDEARAARRGGRLAEPDVSLTLDNPLCGDRVTVDLDFDGDRIVDFAHRVRGCALCQASASAIGANALGRSPDDLRAAHAAVRRLLAGVADGEAGLWAELRIFAPVAPVKSRHDCVLLPFETLDRAFTASGR